MTDLFSDDDDTVKNNCTVSVKAKADNCSNQNHLKSIPYNDSPTTVKGIIDTQLEIVLTQRESQPKKNVTGSIKLTTKKAKISNEVAASEINCKSVPEEENAKTETNLKNKIDFNITDLNFDSDDDEKQEADNDQHRKMSLAKTTLIKKLNQLENLKLECQMNSPSSDKQKNSTSTPRSILKNKNKHNEISYSPLILTQTQNNKAKKNISFLGDKNACKQERKPLHDQCLNVSVVGMTQALDLLNSPNTSIKANENKNINMPIQPCFDMKSTLYDLFTDDDLIETECNLSASKAKTKLRFDETSLPKKSDFNLTSKESSTDDSLIINKVKLTSLFFF